MNFLDELNPEQREAVLLVDGPLLILAGAGSGKTRVIAYRIAYLIGAGHADAREVVAVTFTNKAAEEMRSRVETLLGDAATGAWVSTFHSMCARLLRREAPAIGLSRDFVIYDSTDQVSAMKQVMRDLNIDDSVLQPKAALGRISHAKNLMQGPEAFLDSYNPRDAQLGKLFAGYQKALARSNALDFDDLLLKTVELFDKAADVRARYASRFRFLLVDEYQDTNRPQYLLMRRLSEAHRNICVVGDPDQSIYKWRGADLRNIMDFEADYPDAKVVRLERNYRSTQVILDAASAVISQNRNRKEKRLWTEQKGGDKLSYYFSNDELEEADVIARVARTAVGTSGDTPMAVLYRTNAQSRVIEDALRREGIAYRIIGSVRFYERKEVKDTLAYLKLLINPDDDVSLRRVINVPTRGIGKGVMESLESAPPVLGLSGALGLSPNSMWSRLAGGLDHGAFSGRAAASLRVFRDLMIGLFDVARQDPVSIAIGKVLDRTGYLQELRDERTEEALGRIENLMELVSAAKEYETRDEAATLGGFVDRLSLLSDTDEAEGAADARVLMMTLHSAKGLEFPLVFIAGLEEGLFPHSRSTEDEAELEEERRLCYVGMTRARKKLILASAARRRWYGEYRACAPSRFIDEVPEELIERIESVAPSVYQAGLWGGRGSGGSAYGGYRASGARGSSPTRLKETSPTYVYEDEDQSRSGHLEAGAKVRHAQFGLGTVISVEPADGDVKLVVRFNSVGSKRLLAKYAKLEVL
ncbi:MAG TPA: UvrD-helicase domain-containing protein [Vicinamibacterales bacterium]|jgi:DNA helicase-2/ATP-dependent DNA helicase PcrA